MTNSKVIIDNLRHLIYKHAHDYEVVDMMEAYLEEIEDAVTPSPQIEVELEYILDMCATHMSNGNGYGEVLGSVDRVKDMVYGN